MARRDAARGGGGVRARAYVSQRARRDGPRGRPRWERAVHDPGVYDLEVDTSAGSSEACAAAILRRLAAGPPVAFAALAARR